MTNITTYLYDQQVEEIPNEIPIINTLVYEKIVDVIISLDQEENFMSMFYAPNVKVYRGVDNKIKLQFKNRDQKRLSLLDRTATFILTDKDTGTAYLEKTVEAVDAARGLAVVRLTESDLLNLDAKYYTYAIKTITGEGETELGFVDDNYGANGTLEILDGVYPTFTESTTEDFAPGNTGSTIYIDPHINRNDAIHTAQIYFSSSYTGTLTIEGSLSPAVQGLNNDDFVTIKQITYTNQTAQDTVNFTGVYSAVRFVRSSAELEKVVYRP